MRRIDHVHDPRAPAANTRSPGVSAAVRDERGRLLMIRRADNGKWSLPGGAHELGESVADTAVRETAEETGLAIEATGLVGIYTDPGHRVEFDDGRVLQEFTICVHARPVGGELRADGTETTAAAWVEPARVAELDLHPFARLLVEDALSGRPRPRLG